VQLALPTVTGEFFGIKVKLFYNFKPIKYFNLIYLCEGISIFFVNAFSINTAIFVRTILDINSSMFLKLYTFTIKYFLLIYHLSNYFIFTFF